MYRHNPCKNRTLRPRLAVALAFLPIMLAVRSAAAPATEPAPAVRVPMPSAAELVRADGVVRELYATDLRSAAIAPRPDIAGKFLKAAVTSGADDLAVEFVLLREAGRAAYVAGDAETLVVALDRAAARFGMDRIAVLSGLTTAKVPADADARRRLEGVIVGLADEAARADNVAGANQLLTAADAAFRKASVPDVAKRMQARQQQLVHQQAAARSAAAARVMLAAKPDDAPAHLAVGRYLCLFRDDWTAGVPHLAKGSDPALKALAVRERGIPTDAREQVALASAWWDYAATAPLDARLPALLRARSWYRKGRDAAGGLAKVLADKRVTVIEVELGLALSSPPVAVKPPADDLPAGKPVDLLALVTDDLAKHVVSGQWTRDDKGQLTCGGGTSRLEFPIDGPDEYDFVVEFTRPVAGADFVMMCSTRGTPFAFCAGGAGGREFAITKLDGRRFQGNPTFASVDGLLAPDEPHRAEVRVRRDEVIALLDGNEMCRHKTDFSDLAADPFFSTRDPKHLGIASWSTPTTVLMATLTPVDAQAKPVPLPAPIAPVAGLRTVVFVCDAGGSMKEEWRTVKSEMRKALGNLEDGQGFNVILIKDNRTVFYRPNRLVGMSTTERDACLAWLDAASVKGAAQTDVLGAVRAGLALQPNLLYLLSDFDVRAPQVTLPRIRDANKDGRTRLSSVVVGTTKAAAEAYLPLAKQLAADNGGNFRIVTVE
jgi:hypothetical protein